MFTFQPAIQSEDEEDLGPRLFWCQMLQMMRQVVANVYINTLFFNFFFRVILIRFPDRGLVVEGRPELTLFHQLYWTIFIAFFCMGIFSYPISKIVTGTYQESILGSVCLLNGAKPETDSQDNMRNRLAMLAYIGITEFTNQYFSWKVLMPFSCFFKFTFPGAPTPLRSVPWKENVQPRQLSQEPDSLPGELAVDPQPFYL